MAAVFSAPGIKKLELDQSDVIGPTSTSIGAMVGKTSKGRICQRLLSTTDKEFYENFGTPVSGHSSENTYYGAGEFLKESNQLWFVRTSDGTERYSNKVFFTNASGTAPSNTTISASTTTALLSQVGFSDGNTSTAIYDIDSLTPVGSLSVAVACVGPGTYGDDIGISIITCASENTQGFFDWGYKFDTTTSAGLPSPSASTLSTLYDKLYKIKVFIKPSTQSSNWFNTSPQSQSATPVEEFLVSNWLLAKDASGKSLYAKDVINGNSKYIYVMPVTNTYPGATSAVYALTNGADSSAKHTAGVRQSGWSLFADREKVDTRILIVPDEPTDANDVSVINYVGNIASSRQDSISVGQVGSTSTSDQSPQQIVNILNTRGYGFNVPSYTALYAGYSKVYDRFSDKFIYMPNAIFGASLMARTDRLANTWDAPAGVNRGIVGVAQDQLYKFNETQCGYLYDNNINSVKFIRGYNYVMFSQKTAQRKKSATDRINVRRLLNFIATSIEPSLIPFLFEPNTDKVRNRVSTVVDGFLQGIVAGNGLTAKKVVCDETNNTSDIIDNNQLWVDIYLQPTKTIEFIQLRSIITRTGVTFE